MFKASLLFITILCISNISSGQSVQDSLFKVLKTNDSLVFEVGFNKCDLNQFDQFVSDDFEFYHDEAGIIRSKTSFIESVKKNICQLTYKPRRELIAGSLTVYPLFNNGKLYGAIQTGRHRFYAITNNAPDKLTSVAQFTTLWIRNTKGWQMQRVLSFDHKDKDENALERSFFEKDDEINLWLNQNHVPALGIGIIEDNVVRSVKVYGKLNMAEPVSYNTIFSVASLTKPVTSMLTLKLVGMGKWDLDEPLYKYWIDPDIKSDIRYKKLTTRIVLSHQTGFPNWRYMNSDNKLAFQFDPGTKYQYSGEGFEYLRNALEHKFHMTLDQLADSLIFKPLKMSDSHFFWDGELDSSRVAHGFDKKGNMLPYNFNKKANAADLLKTTVADYSTFIAGVINFKLFPENVFRQMITPQIKIKENQSMGLGWEVYDLGNNQYALGHGGNEEGVHTQVFFLPQSKKGLVIFTNVTDGYKLYIKLIAEYLRSEGKKIIDIELK